MNVATVIAFVVSLLIQVSFPLVVVLLYRRRTGAPWIVYGYGAAVFAVFQLFTWLPLSVYLDYAIGDHLDSALLSFLWLMAQAAAVSLVEESGRWLGFRVLFKRGGYRLNWKNGVMYGLGHGSIETVLLIAGLTFVNLLTYLLLSRLDLSAVAGAFDANAEAIEASLRGVIDTTWNQPLTVAIERIPALFHQVTWSLLVMQSLVSRQKRWFGFAVLYHTSVAVLVPGLARLGGFIWPRASIYCWRASVCGWHGACVRCPRSVPSSMNGKLTL